LLRILYYLLFFIEQSFIILIKELQLFF